MRNSNSKSLLALSLGLALIATTFAAGRVQGGMFDFGEAKVLATVPTPPGFPEGIAVHGNRVYVSGPATFGTTGKPPSRVLVFNRLNGVLVQDFQMIGEDLLQEHANSCLALDAQNRVYVLNTQLGLVRLNPNTGVQTIYAPPLPNLPICALVPAGTPCSPTPLDLPPLPNDIAFDEKGYAYITDSMQATIWRVEPGGGEPQIWYQDNRFFGNPAFEFIGVNGLRLSPDRKKVFVTVTADLLGQGYIYTVPLVEIPPSGSAQVFHQYTGAEAPDGIAFSSTGKLYVTLAAPFNSGISILRPDGTEQTQLTNSLLSPIFPYDSPANIAFNGLGSLLVTNHAFVTGWTMPQQFTILEVFVGELASPLAKPALP